MTTVGLLALLAVAGGAVLLLLDVLIRRPSVAAGLMLGYLALDHANLMNWSFTAGGINVGTTDVVSAVLATAGVARIVRTRGLTGAHYIFWAVVGFATYSVLAGVLAFGIGTAVNEARGWVYFLGPVLYFCTVRPDAVVFDKIGKYWVWAGAAVAAVALLRWATIAVGVSPPPLGGLLEWRADNLRVVRARETMLIVQAFFIAAVAGWHRLDDTYRRVAVALLAVAVLLQHRTVWVALAAALVVAFWRNRQLARRLGAAALAALTVALLFGVTVLDADTDQLGTHAADTHTWEWRVEGWRELVAAQRPRTPTEFLLGRPFGSGYERRVDGSVSDVVPHSFYLEAFLRLGVLGVLAILCCFAAILQRLRRGPSLDASTGLLPQELVLYLFVAQAVFGITYHNELGAGLVVGLALGTGLRSAGTKPAQPLAIRATGWSPQERTAPNSSPRV